MTDARDTTRAPAAPLPAEVIRLAARAYERDRYLSALLAPRPLRSDLVALAAFAGEIARIPAFVSEPMVGAIRLQWWHDTLDAPPDGPPTGHPIADAIVALARRRSLPLGLLHRYIDATEVALAETPIASDLALAAHLDATEGTLFALAAIISGADAGGARATLDAAARAYGIARLLCEMPALTAQRRTLLPQMRLAAAGTSVADLAAGAEPPALATELEAMASDAHRNLAEARRGLDGRSGRLLGAILPVALVEPYLAAVERGNWRPGGAVHEIAPLTRVWRLWWAGRRRMI